MSLRENQRSKHTNTNDIKRENRRSKHININDIKRENHRSKHTNINDIKRENHRSKQTPQSLCVGLSNYYIEKKVEERGARSVRLHVGAY